MLCATFGGSRAAALIWIMPFWHPLGMTFVAAASASVIGGGRGAQQGRRAAAARRTEGYDDAGSGNAQHGAPFPRSEKAAKSRWRSNAAPPLGRDPRDNDGPDRCDSDIEDQRAEPDIK